MNTAVATTFNLTVDAIAIVSTAVNANRTIFARLVVRARSFQYINQWSERDVSFTRETLNDEHHGFPIP